MNPTPPVPAPGSASRSMFPDLDAAYRQRAVHRGDYLASSEELTPGGGDPLAALPVVMTALATLVRPAAWQHFAGGSVGAYSLTPAAWQELRAFPAASSRTAVAAR